MDDIVKSVVKAFSEHYKIADLKNQVKEEIRGTAHSLLDPKIEVYRGP